jgi:hypothetical protein
MSAKKSGSEESACHPSHGSPQCHLTWNIMSRLSREGRDQEKIERDRNAHASPGTIRRNANNPSREMDLSPSVFSAAKKAGNVSRFLSLPQCA